MYFLGSRMMADELLIFSGTADAELAVAIASFLILRAQRFPDRKIPFEISFKLRMPLESTEVFPVQSLSSLPESNVVELPAPVDAYHARIAAGHAHLPGTRPRAAINNGPRRHLITREMWKIVGGGWPSKRSATARFENTLGRNGMLIKRSWS
jgi:hypothetical protein